MPLPPVRLAHPRVRARRGRQEPAHRARRALSEGWRTSEFAGPPQKIHDSLLKGLATRTTPLNNFLLLFAAQHAIEHTRCRNQSTQTRKWETSHCLFKCSATDVPVWIGLLNTVIDAYGHEPRDGA